MKKLLLVSAIMIFMFLGNQVTMIDSHESQYKTTTYVNSQVDTVRFKRYSTLTGMTFAAVYQDSVALSSAILRRIFNGVWASVRAGDTLFTAQSNTSGSPSVVLSAVNVSPYCDEYAVIVTYSSGNNGVTSNSVMYKAEQQFYYKQ